MSDSPITAPSPAASPRSGTAFRIRTLVGVCVLLMAGLVLFGTFTGEGAAEGDIREVRSVAVSVDNDEIIRTGVAMIGYQLVDVMITEGRFKGRTVTAHNRLVGTAEIDELYEPGDAVLIAIRVAANEPTDVKALNRSRTGWEALLFAAFVVLLVVYARFIGLRALCSFIASLAIIWRYLLPGLLSGGNPLVLASMTLALLTAVIIFSVAGFTKKGLAAVLGTLAGLAVAIALTLFFGNQLALGGMTMPFAATLLFSGHLGLDMQGIFYAAVIIGASGAAMDIAMDVAASMQEVKEKKPDIGMSELVASGFTVGRAVVGTMATTLLLAYSGGYLTMLMLFVSKDASFIRILNYKLVAAEIFRTLIGSIGLVLVAPLTAMIAGVLFSGSLREHISRLMDMKRNNCQ